MKSNTSSVTLLATDDVGVLMAVAERLPEKEMTLARAAGLLGGARILRRSVKSPLDAHELIVRGLPVKALVHLIESLVILGAPVALEKCLGMSVRTIQRHKDSPAKSLSTEQSGRAWRFAEILAKATEVFGSQKDAEEWFEQPATGLNQRRPIDLLNTPAGAELVADFLGRLEYGVYV